MNHRPIASYFLSRLKFSRSTLNVVLLATLGFVLHPTASIGEDESPRLVIDSRGPSGLVSELLFTPDGKTLISLGHDKAIRFWDVESGDLHKTLRLEVGDAHEGKLYAGAISPDGRWLAVGGFPIGSGKLGHPFYLIELETNQVAAMLQGHENVIQAIAFSDDGCWLASGSNDDSVRVWDVAEAKGRGSGGALEITASQKLEGHSADVHAVGFAPGGNRLVSGGFDHKLILWSRDGDGQFSQVETMEKHTAEVRSAAFSPDGEYIVSGGDDHRLLLWDGRSGNFLRTLEEDMENQVGTSTFSPDGGRVLASSQTFGKGYTSIYVVGSGERVATFTDHNNGVAASAWHPSGTTVASAGGDDLDIYLWRPDSGEIVHHLRGEGRSGRAVAFAERGGLDVAFGQTSEGSGLLGNHLQNTFDFSTFTLNAISEDQSDPLGFRRTETRSGGAELIKTAPYHLQTGSGEIAHDPALYNGIRSYSITPDGDVVVGSDYSLRLHSPDGKPIRTFIGHEGIVWAVSPSPDGRYLASASADQTVRLWSLKQSSEPIRIAMAGTPLENTEEGFFISDLVEGYPGRESGLKVGDLLTSIDDVIFHSIQDVVDYVRTKSPGDKVIYQVLRNGKHLEFSLTLGEYIVPPNIAPLVSLFVSRDGEWVCWLPSGHYHASPGGEKYIGWHINKGIDKVAEYYPAYVFREQFHHPELVKRTVLLGNFEKAFAEVGAKKVDLTKVLPPKIDWILPQATRGGKAAGEVTVRAEISSPDADLEEVKLLVNGKALAADFRVSGNKMTYERTVELLPGENRLAIFARNSNAGHTSDERVVHVAMEEVAKTAGRSEASLEQLLKPNLYVLAVGVSEYEDGSIPALEYCDDDATAIAEFFQKQSGGIFGKTEVRRLVNEDATEDGIQESLDWLEDQATQKDFVVLFLAAHGINDEKGNFYLLPTDGDAENLRRTGVAWDDFGEILGNLPSRVLMFLDTCHSGQLGTNLFTFANVEGTRSRSAGGLKSVFDPSEAIRELTSEENGVVIMAASTGDEESLENDEWGHGAFTFALLEGLGGKADVNGDAVIHLRELDFFISDRVKELTKGVQHPTTVKPSSISRLPVAAVK